MADADVMKTINDNAATRVHLIFDAFAEHAAVTINTSVALAAAFNAAADALREEAELWTKSKRRGWQSTSKELIRVAARMAGIGVDLLNSKIDPSDHQPFEPTPEITITEVADTETSPDDPAPEPERMVANEHGLSVPVFGGGPVERYDNPSTGDREIFDSAPSFNLAPVEVDKPVSPSAETMAYLRDDPTSAPPTLNEEAKQMTQTFPMGDANPFLDPEPIARRPAASGAPEGWAEHRRTVADLMRPMPPTVKHWSFSQLTTLEDCGVKYRLQRLEGVPQVPQWANVGGTAFHLATETYDRAVFNIQSIGARVPMITHEIARDQWEVAFATTINTVAQETGVEPGEEGQHWRAARGGAENYTWWLTSGPDFVYQYIKMRENDLAAVAPITPLAINGELVIEWEYERTVSGPLGDLTMKGVVDRAYLRPDGSIMIVDLKTGRSELDGAQLAEYAYAILDAPNPPGEVGVFGQFWDARRGIHSEPIDLLAEYPHDMLVYRLHAAEAARRAGIYSPRKSSYCVSCSVRYACPIGGPSQ